MAGFAVTRARPQRAFLPLNSAPNIIASHTLRVLVLVALLCTAALPVLEAAHEHALVGGGADCLLCHSPAVVPAVSAAVLPLLMAFGGFVLARLAPRAYATPLLSRRPRGPPSFF